MDILKIEISQNADDTSLSKNWSPEKLDSKRTRFFFFADTSGLNINFAKTKMVVNSHKITYHSKTHVIKSK